MAPQTGPSPALGGGERPQSAIRHPAVTRGLKVWFAKGAEAAGCDEGPVKFPAGKLELELPNEMKIVTRHAAWVEASGPPHASRLREPEDPPDSLASGGRRGLEASRRPLRAIGEEKR